MGWGWVDEVGYIPCMTSGTFIRRQSNPGHRDINGWSLCPINGARRCLAKAEAVRANAVSRYCGSGLVHSLVYSYTCPWYVTRDCLPLELITRNLRYPSYTRSQLQQCVHTQHPVNDDADCIPVDGTHAHKQ